MSSVLLTGKALYINYKYSRQHLTCAQGVAGSALVKILFSRSIVSLVIEAFKPNLETLSCYFSLEFNFNEAIMSSCLCWI